MGNRDKLRPLQALALAWVLAVAGCSQSDPTNQESAEAKAAPAEAGPAAGGIGPERIKAVTATVDTARIINADSEPQNWLEHGRTYSEQRFSPLDQINDQNVKELGLAWYWDTGTTRGLEATPIVVDGVMFSTGSWSLVFAHDAKTGELLWRYDPQVPRDWGKFACCDVVNRGVAVYKGRVYVGTIDGRLIALDAATGKPDWQVQTTDPERPYTITGAPRVLKDLVIIGNGGAEYGVRGYITAYDTQTGEQRWRFYTVPGDPSKPFEGEYLKRAATTWLGGKWWEVGGGGTAWDSMAYDPELDLLYVGTGNGSPWNRYIRSPGGGDNLYLSSIVAIDPDDGSYVWHYQTTPGDHWDYTATQHMILADLEIGGQMRKVIIQAPKNGFFYVLDRETGEFISAEAYVPITWASRVDPETGRPVENDEAHYQNKTATVRPGPLGGHNWHPMSYSPLTRLVYIPALGLSFRYAQDNAFHYNPETWNLGIDMDQFVPTKDPDQMIKDLSDVKGHLAAWDPVKQREVWRVEHATAWNGGVLSTAGNLVFQGRADGYFAAYAADSGKLLWETPIDIGAIAPPITYAVDGEQYIALVAGWGGAFGLSGGVPRQKGNKLREGRILAFKLGGDAKPAPVRVTAMKIPTPPKIDTNDEEIALGEHLFHANCAVCHGPGATGGGVIPDLRYSSPEVHAAWNAIVLGGAYVGKGMASFSHVLDEKGAHAIHAYIISQAQKSIELCESEYRRNYPELLDTACEQQVVTSGE